HRGIAGPGLRHRGPVLRAGAAQSRAGRPLSGDGDLGRFRAKPDTGKGGRTGASRSGKRVASSSTRSQPARPTPDTFTPSSLSASNRTQTRTEDRAMDENKKRALSAALGQIDKQFGKGSVMRMG